MARVKEFVEYKDPKTGKVGRRNTDTMPGSAGSSWYFFRYADPKNSEEAFSFEAQKYWMPVDLYVGGPEHTVGHLLYSRFWTKILFDVGLSSYDEPFKKLAHQGDILGPDGFRMSKSRGNVVNPDDVREEYGADATRLYICFMGPFDKAKPWSSQGIDGVRRFLDRIWRLCVDENGTPQAVDVELPESLNKLLHKTIKKVGDDIENMNFNTAISAMMVLVNEIYRLNLKPRNVLMPLAQLLMPLAPHIAEEIWAKLGGKGLVSLAPWPSFDPALVVDDLMEMGVQVAGKMRGTIQVSEQTSEEDAVKMAREVVAVKNALEGKTIVKVVYKPGKILNLIVK